MTEGPRFRFAPSPTGMFHVGGARTALQNWALARRLGGTFVLRVEDTDEVRNRPEWTQGIIDALAWIGISADDPHFEGPHFQSDYAAAHVEAANRLFEQGDAYYCDLNGEQIQERAKELGLSGYDGYSRDRGLGPGPGRVLGSGSQMASRWSTTSCAGEVRFDNSTIEDFVLLPAMARAVFVIANVVDDIEMAITHVVRAEEHLPNTPKQQMLWTALGHQPPAWGHVPVLVNEQRKKLSKRRDKVSLEQYRDEGYLADAMVNYLMTLGWTPPGAEEAGSEIVSWDEMEAAFRLEDVTHSPAFFDVKKLAAFNGDYIRAMPLDEFIERCRRRVAGRVGSRDVRLDRAPHPAAAHRVVRRPRRGRLPVLACRRCDRLRRGQLEQGVRARLGGGVARRCHCGVSRRGAERRRLVDGRCAQGVTRVGDGDLRDQARQGTGACARCRDGPVGRSAAFRVARDTWPRRNPPTPRPCPCAPREHRLTLLGSHQAAGPRCDPEAVGGGC